MTRIWLCFLIALPCAAETVRFRTSDGITIVASYRAAGPDAATVVCLPMYRHDRRTYRPLESHLLEKGLNVLSVDLRGHGESAPHLRPDVAAGKPALFNAMHLDVAAAIEFLERERGCDLTRLGLVGASVGCSVAVDATVRHPHRVRAVVLLTPGPKYLGVNTLGHLDRWPGARILTCCSIEEQRTSAPIIKQLKVHAGSSSEFIDQRGIHGTRMFGRVEGIETRIAEFLEAALVLSVDLRVQTFEPEDSALDRRGPPAGLHRPGRRVGETTYSLLIWAVADRWHLGAMVDRPFAGTLRFVLGDRRVELPFDTARPVEHEILGTVNGDKSVAITQAAAGGTTWVLFALPKREKETKLTLEFRAASGRVLRLPGGGTHFKVVPQFGGNG